MNKNTRKKILRKLPLEKQKRYFPGWAKFLMVAVLFIGIIIGGITTQEVQAFVFGSANQITQWIKDTTTVRLRTETDSVRVGSTGTLFVSPSLNRVGIGTTTPSGLLHAQGTAVTVSATTGGVTFGETNGSGSYFSWGAEHRIRIYAYKNVNGIKVFSPLYQSGGFNSGAIEDYAYFTWGWTAVAGADGYRVFIFSDGDDLGRSYDYYSDVVTNSLTDNGGDNTGTEAAFTTPTTLYSGNIFLDAQIDNLYSSSSSLKLWAPLYAHGDLDIFGAFKIRGARFANAWSSNTTIGLNAGALLTNETGNTLIGNNAGNVLVGGNGNTLIGAGAGGALTSGYLNILIGENAGSAITTGGLNVIVGNATAGPTTGTGNILLGYGISSAGASSNNIIIGYQAGTQAGYSNNLVIGASGGTPTSNNNAVIGSQANRYNEFYLGAGYRANPDGQSAMVLHDVVINATSFGGQAGYGVNSRGADLGLSGGRGFINGADSAPGGVIKFFYSHNETPQSPFWLTPRWEKMRVVSDGLMIADAYQVGTEKITNGTFTGNANNWTLGTGWAYSANTVLKNADGTGTLSQTAANMVTAPVAGEWYVLDFTITGWTVAGGKVDVVAGGTRITTFNSADRHIFLFQATDTTGLTFYPASATRLTIDNVSLKPVNGGNLTLFGNIVDAGSANGGAGIKIGTATTQKLGFWNATPVVQPSSTGETVGFTAGAGTAVLDDSTFTGNVGATAYRISDIVKALKQAGLLAQ